MRALVSPDALGEHAVDWVRAARIDGFGALLIAETHEIVAWPQGPPEPGVPDPVDVLWERERVASTVGRDALPADPLALAVEAVVDALGDAGAVDYLTTGPRVAVVVRGQPAPEWVVPVRTVVTVHASSEDVRARVAGDLTREELASRLVTAATVVPVPPHVGAWRPAVSHR